MVNREKAKGKNTGCRIHKAEDGRQKEQVKR